MNISGKRSISTRVGVSKFSSIILFNPAPNETPINNCGASPINEPKK